MTDEEGSQNLMEQVLELWISPEIERRREAGSLPDDFVVTRAQIIMNLGAEATEVRFNKEIKTVAQFRAARAVEVGEDLTEADVESLKKKWGVALSALLRRSRDLAFISEDQYRRGMI